MRTAKLWALFGIWIFGRCDGPVDQREGDLHDPANGSSLFPSPRFKLSNGLAGLGSNMGRAFPELVVSGERFLLLSKTSAPWQAVERMDTIATGFIAQATIDSILNIARPFFGRSVEVMDPSVMSGGIEWLSVIRGSDTASFRMWNASDTTAQALMELLERGLPREVRLLHWQDLNYTTDTVIYLSCEG